MKNIATELIRFFEETRVRQCTLADASGVSSATISRIVSGKQSDLKLSTAMDIQSAMDRLRREDQIILKASELDPCPPPSPPVDDGREARP